MNIPEDGERRDAATANGSVYDVELRRARRANELARRPSLQQPDETRRKRNEQQQKRRAIAKNTEPALTEEELAEAKRQKVEKNREDSRERMRKMRANKAAASVRAAVLTDEEKDRKEQAELNEVLAAVVAEQRDGMDVSPPAAAATCAPAPTPARPRRLSVADLRKPPCERPDLTGLTLDDVLTFQAIDEKLLREETCLFSSKWWDYRFMTPLEATLNYVEEYREVYRDIYAREFDYQRGRHVAAHTNANEVLNRIGTDGPEGTEAKRRLTSYWRGRQVADAIGMPYRTFIHETMTARLRFWKHAYMPRPSHLYKDWVVEKAASRWQELQASLFIYANHDAYKATNYQGAPFQDSYIDYLITRARESNNFPANIADMIRNDRLSYQEAQRRISVEDFGHVRDILS